MIRKYRRFIRGNIDSIEIIGTLLFTTLIITFINHYPHVILNIKGVELQGFQALSNVIEEYNLHKLMLFMIAIPLIAFILVKTIKLLFSLYHVLKLLARAKRMNKSNNERSI